MTTPVLDPPAACATPAAPCGPSELVDLPASSTPVRDAPRWDTRLAVLDGVAYVELDEDERPLTPGDEAVLRGGRVARYFNAGDSDALLSRCTCIPA